MKKTSPLVALIRYEDGKTVLVNPNFVTLVHSRKGADLVTVLDIIGWSSNVMQNVTQLWVTETVEQVAEKFNK